MEIADSSAANRNHLEHVWRARLEATEDAYRTAVAQYLRLMFEASATKPARAVEEARAAAARALQEHTRVARILTALTMRGKLPEESIAREAFSR